ncbi:predicted protein [Postia placenta Mad-698-R]|nr:predicted protein [Postia placenta Mad-698-R]
MITGCVSAEVEACYILPPDTPQPLVYTYHVIAEDEHPADSGNPRDDTTTPPVATATGSYRSLGWHDLSANLHLMTVRVGREFIKRPLHYQHLLPIDALVHIPIIRLVHPDVVEPASLHIEQESPVEDMPRPPKRKRCPDTETDEVPTKRVRTSGTASEASEVEDGVPFGPHPRCMITGHASAIVRRDLRELWETNRLLMIPHPQHLEHFEYCTVYKYCVIAEDEHPPDSCATMRHPITPSVMTAPCSYRSLGWHELDADLYSMAFRAGRKLSKRPLHYQHILRELLPHKEINHVHIIICHPLSSPISASCLRDKEETSRDTRVDSKACTMEEQVARVRLLAEPEDPKLLIYQQEEVRDVVPAVEAPWLEQYYLSSSQAISCISEFIAGGGGGMQLRAWRLSGVDTYHLTSDENIRFLLFNERSPPIWPNGIHSPDIKI